MHNFVIIGGTTKAGTTSLFKYLGDHPNVCKSSLKETRFFLDKDYPLENRWNCISKEEYLKLYHCTNTELIKLEATTDYLYSKNTPQKIVNTLGYGNVKMVFILRDPVDRFISWFKFAMQDGKIDKATTLREYFKANKESGRNAPQHLQALRQGFYSKYLPVFIDNLGKENVEIVYFSDLVEKPQFLLKKLSNFTCLDPSFYNTYNFVHHNKTQLYKHPKLNGLYKMMKRRLREIVGKQKLVRKLLGWSASYIESIYKKVNPPMEDKSSFDFNSDILNLLNDYYSDELVIFKNRSYVEDEHFSP